MTTVRVSIPETWDIDVYPNARFASNDKGQLDVREVTPDRAFHACKQLALYAKGQWVKAVYVHED